jgi:hypothetical protein
MVFFAFLQIVYSVLFQFVIFSIFQYHPHILQLSILWLKFIYPILFAWFLLFRLHHSRFIWRLNSTTSRAVSFWIALFINPLVTSGQMSESNDYPQNSISLEETILNRVWTFSSAPEIRFDWVSFSRLRNWIKAFDSFGAEQNLKYRLSQRPRRFRSLFNPDQTSRKISQLELTSAFIHSFLINKARGPKQDRSIPHS